MARLTWQQVDAPDLGRAADILNSAANQIGSGGSLIAGAARQARSDQMDRRSAAALPLLAGIQSSGDVAGALRKIGQVVRPEDMNEETRKAYLGLMGQGLDFDKSRAGTAAVRNADGRAQTEFQRGIAREDQEAALAGALLARKEGGYRESLIGTESGGNWAARNNAVGSSGRPGHHGRVQFGHDRFEEAKAAGAVPPGMTIEEFGSDTEAGRAAQMSAEDWHFGDLERQLAPYVGSVVNGQTLDMGALVAMGHLGGAGGAIKYVTSGGKYNPADSNGTSLSDYAATHGGQGPAGRGVADLVPENNLLGMDFWDVQSDDYRAQENEGYDERRSRQADREIDLEKAVQAAGKDLLTEAVGSVQLESDIPDAVATLAREKNLPLSVVEAALAGAESASVKSQFAVGSDDVVAGTPVSADADKSVTVFDSAVNDYKNTNETVRIQSNASEFNSDPALQLTEKMGLTADDKGDTLAAIEQLRESAKAEGINLSPSEAASLLYESAERAGFSAALVPGFEKWGETYYRPDAALAAAKNYMTEEQKGKGREVLVDVERAEAASKQLREEMSTVMKGLGVATARGDEEAIAKWSKKRDLLEEQALKIEANHGGFLPKPKGKDPKGETGTTTTPAPTKQDPLEAAAMRVADQALQVGTEGGIDLAGLAKASTEMQVRVLETAIENLVVKGAPKEQIAALQGLLQEAITADAAEMNNR